MGAAPLLRCLGLSKSFPGVLALDQISLDVHAGSVHALVGENGAGKSTLIKLLAGAHRPDGGHIEIEGRPVDIRDARDAHRHGIAAVHQELNLVRDLSVAENILLGRWPRSPYTGLIDYRALHQRSRALLDSLQIELPLRAEVAELTVARQQMVEIARALSLKARILILDEPSAVLTPHELEALFRLVRGLVGRAERNVADMAVIYISHRLEEIFDLADFVTVLRDGRGVSTRPIGDVTRSVLIAEMVGRELRDEFPRRTCPIGETALSVRQLSAGSRFHDVTFEVRRGEVLAVAGLVGSGRTSVLKTIFGAARATAGTVRVNGTVGPFCTPRQAMAAGIACLPEDRKQEGLLLERNVRENATLATVSSFARGGVLRVDHERAVTRKRMAELRIKSVGPEAAVNTLSGGNQQKVLIARWLDRPHRVFLFDEPTRGIDVGAKYEIYEWINRLAGNGAAIVMVSSELPETIGMADRIAVMHEGRLTGILDNDRRQVTQEQIMDLAAVRSVSG